MLVRAFLIGATFISTLFACSAGGQSAQRRGTSGDAERSLQQIAEFTSRLFGASTAADVNASFREANRRRSRRPQR